MANSTQRVSRTMVTRIWPGYCSSLLDFARDVARQHVGLFVAQLPRLDHDPQLPPACSAKHFSTPGKDMPIRSKSSTRLM